jgi:hypothetical protein
VLREARSLLAVVASASEAIQRARKILDCFVAGACHRTAHSRDRLAPLRKRFAFVAGNDAAPSTCVCIPTVRIAPELCIVVPLGNQRAQGMPGVRCARSSRAK